MVNKKNTDAAIAVGARKADETFARRQIARAHRAQALAIHPRRLGLTVMITDEAGASVPVATSQTAGFLVAAGDSWFDYPFHDVLKLLDDHFGYDVESAAHRGDPIEAMAYQGGQLDKFARCLEKVKAHGGVPKAILLSGGGDDIAGNEFGMLLNNAGSPGAGWNGEIIDGLLNQRILIAYKSMLTSMTDLGNKYFSKTLPILIHGYDYPVPDGRGFWGGWPFPGPWLEPGFREKLFRDLPTNLQLMHDIIDRFNEMLTSLTQDATFSHVHYVNLRNKLSTDLTNNAYQGLWDNELHPTGPGFDIITKEFADVLGGLP